MTASPTTFGSVAVGRVHPPAPRRRDPVTPPGVVLRLPDGTAVCLRPLRRGDRGSVRRVFDGLSAESRHMRFLTPTPRLSGPMLSYLADVDHDRHAAWVAVLDGRPIGIGRYVRDRAVPTEADFACEVVDEHQGRGVGRILLRVLGAVAAAGGVSTFTYLVDPDNTASLSVLRPYLSSRRFTAGAVEGRGPVPDDGLARRADLVALAALAARSSAG